MDEADATPDTPEPTTQRTTLRGLRVIVAAPGPTPAGGMCVQADLLSARLRDEDAIVRRVATNPPAPAIIAPMLPLADSWRRCAYTRRFREAICEGADVLVIHGASGDHFRHVVAPSLTEARDAGLRTIVRWDGGDADRYFSERTAEAAAGLANADTVVVPSGFLAEVFRRRLGIETTIVPNLVRDPDDSQPPVRASGPLRLVCTRHHTKTYGVDVVLDAVVLAAAQGADVEITFAGDGPERTRLEETARETLGNRARFLGAVAHERVLGLLTESDVLVNGSWVDNFPVSLAEALAAGVPVATTDVGGIRWVVQHGRTGLVTPAGDAEALAGSIVALARDRALLEDLGWRAKVEALRWTWPAVRGDWFPILTARRARQVLAA